MLMVSDISRAVAEVYGLTRGDLRLPGPRLPDNRPMCRGGRDAVEARHVVSYLARRLTTRSWSLIADRLGYHNHTAPMHGARNIASRLTAGDAVLEERVARVLAKFTLLEVCRAVPAAGETPAPPLLATP